MNKLDLNLLKVLQVLLDEQNVTTSAQRLHVSQSAVSKHLAKLREMFNDPLFVRTAQGLKPTPRALELAPQLHQVIGQLEQITRPAGFVPGLSQRQFNIHFLDTAYPVTFPFFMPSVLSQAPHVRLKTDTWNENSLEDLLKCELDMGIACREWDKRSPIHIKDIPSELNYVELIREHSVCLVRHHHPALSDNWNLATFMQYRHIQVTFGGMAQWLLDDVLSLQGLRRNIAIDMPDFHGAMNLCEQSDLILCAPARFATQVAAQLKLQVLPLPVAIDPGAYVLLWNKHFDHDQGHKWLRTQIIDNVSSAK